MEVRICIGLHRAEFEANEPATPVSYPLGKEEGRAGGDTFDDQGDASADREDDRREEANTCDIQCALPNRYVVVSLRDVGIHGILSYRIRCRILLRCHLERFSGA